MATLRDNDALKGYTDKQLMEEMERRRKDANSKFAMQMTIRQSMLQRNVGVLLEVADKHHYDCGSSDDQRRNPERCARCFLLVIDRDHYVPDADEQPGWRDLQLQIGTVHPPHSS